ncbi:MAG: hypoxanthine phosphoribosyltransferase [Anaerolineaceae bacterium]|nr:hypoxanthine phosphoribosyltransferase [Anaerolineaceae bacterium]
MIDCERYVKKVLLDEETIQRRIAELGAQISADYVDVDQLLLVCILKGGILFLSDLMRHIHVPHELDFIAVSSYGVGVRSSSHDVRIEKDLSIDISNKHLLIVEDIIDTGYTLDFVISMLRARSIQSLRLVTLLNKQARRVADIPLDYVGFHIDDHFVFGYGLDLDERCRQLPYVAVADLAALDRS